MKIQANGLTLHVRDEGAGTPVLLLHGFPDSGRLWRHQVPALVAAGHRVIVPDLRGFGESDRPPGVDAYAFPAILDDVGGIMDALGIERAAVVGHDWGAAVAWAMAGLAPQRVERLVALTVGHPAGFFTDAMGQRERSWYMLFFQHHGVAEEALREDDWRLLRQLLRGGGDMDAYLTDLARPGALTAALSWYRANIPASSFGLADPLPLPPVSCPALGVWATHDALLGEAQMVASAAHCLGPWRCERVEGAGHWIPLDAPDLLNRLLVEFLAPESARTA
jgi:pimeloyl-ACP methyl ester carboxylesterase